MNTIKLVKNLVMHHGSKYIELNNYIWKKYQNRSIEVGYIPF